MGKKQPPLIIDYGTKIYKVSKKDMKAYKEVVEAFRTSQEPEALKDCVEQIKAIAKRYKPIGENVFSYFQVRELLQKQIGTMGDKMCAAIPDLTEEQKIKVRKIVNNMEPIQFGLFDKK